jgi:hypothetical protein
MSSAYTTPNPPTDAERWAVWCERYASDDRRTHARMTWLAGVVAAAILIWFGVLLS